MPYIHWPAAALSLLYSVASAGMLLLCFACTRQPIHSLRPAFYSWQTTLDVSPAMRRYLDSTGCRSLYVKVLDVGRDPLSRQVMPYAQVRVADTTTLRGLSLLPTVFLTNEVFRNSSPEERASWVGPLADALHPWVLRGGQGCELQFDCDWTASTREAYFSFLREIKTVLPQATTLSATVRLHQYKFPDQTGVPPVDRGMLMLYNTGDIDQPMRSNSIFDATDARKYLDGAPPHYPLPLDVALPLFSWVLVYRDDALWKIIPEMQQEELLDQERFSMIASDHSNTLPLWEVRRGTFVAGHYLRPGDLLRYECIGPERLYPAAHLAARLPLAVDARVAFFHLDSLTMARYPAALLDSVCSTLRSAPFDR